MLAATASKSEPTRFFQRTPFDTFDSPFHTPSLFVTTSNSRSFESTGSFYNYQQNPQSPESFFSVMADLESPSTRTPSPKTDHLFKEPPSLYNNKHQQLQQIYQSKPEQQQLNTNNTINNNEQIQVLYQQINNLAMEAEKNQIILANYQTILANKDIECQELEYRLLSATQCYESQTQKLNSVQAELAMYQSAFKSRGLELPSLFSGDNESSDMNKYNRLCTLRENLETSKSSSSSGNRDLEGFNSNRRWSEERSPFGITSNNNSSLSSSTSFSIMASTSSSDSERRQQVDDNSRTLVDKNVNINWDSLVERIIKDNDQKTSISLQNRFKNATDEQKELISKAILAHVYELMKNPFGNFLVQKLFEGTDEHIHALANAMKGRVLELTCDQFGCHVVQNILDYVNESVKSSLVSELFEQINSTITHKYAHHVWAKIFEIRWFNTPPPIMKHVHKSIKGRWAQIALDERGSLIIQNIFENLPEGDKRPVIEEVLRNSVIIAKGQWGNWVIQHILEQADRDKDRETAFKIVIDEAIQLSMDQFASKVVEKALRIGGQDFVENFTARISSITCANRPRMALIDIASDQYGNYVIQWLINNSSTEQKVAICKLIKRHMVSLRGSKYGQRVACLVEKILRSNDVTTYPPPNMTGRFNVN